VTSTCWLLTDSNLSVADLVSFARTLTQCDIPHIENVINITFKHISVYICTGGVRIGNKLYPPGFAFSADLIVWGNDVTIMCCMWLKTANPLLADCGLIQLYPQVRSKFTAALKCSTSASCGYMAEMVEHMPPLTALRERAQLPLILTGQSLAGTSCHSGDGNHSTSVYKFTLGCILR
jgi:hypothetical protein